MPKGTLPPPRPITREIASILSAVAEEEVLSDNAIAKRIGISQPQLSIYMRGKRSMPVDRLDQICLVLGLSISTVVAEAERRRGKA